MKVSVDVRRITGDRYLPWHRPGHVVTWRQ